MHVLPSHATMIANPRSVSATPVKVAPSLNAPPETAAPGAALPLRTLDPSLAAKGVDVSNQRPQEGGPAVHPQVQALLDAWGTNDPAFDLDGDGVVGMSDLLLMLSRFGQPPEAVVEEEVAEEGAGTQPVPGVITDAPPNSNTPSVDELLKAWGGSSPAQDLNGDGSVNMADLFQLLAKLSAAQANDVVVPVRPSGEIAPTTGQIDPDANAIPPSPSLIDLLKAWDQPAQTSGLGDSGASTNMSDLFALLQQMAGGGAAGEAAPVIDPTPGSTAKQIDRLIANFKAEGFTSAPPANLNEIVAELGFSPTMKRAFMAKLAEAYPKGMGVSLLG